MLRVNFNDSSSTYTDSVYQWDLNQVLEIAGLNLPVSPVIHFCNRNSTESLLVQSTTSEGVISCPVPNILLKEDLDIVAYIVSMEDQKATTLFKVLIPVNKRVKPSDYEYIDNVPILTYEAIEAEVQSFFTRSKNYTDDKVNRLASDTELKFEKIASDFSRAMFIKEGTTVYGGGFKLYVMGSLLIVENIPGTLATGPSTDHVLFSYSEDYPAVATDQIQKISDNISITLTTNRELKFTTISTSTSFNVTSGIEIFMSDNIGENPQIDNLINQVSELKSDLADVDSAVFTPNVNIFDKNNITVGKAPNTNIGKTISDMVNNVNKFVSNQVFEIKKGDIIYCTVGWGLFAIYDADENYIGKINNGELYNAVTLENAKYMLYSSANTSGYTDNFMLSINVPLPEEYIPFGKTSNIAKNEAGINKINKELHPDDLPIIILDFDQSIENDDIRVSLMEQYGYKPSFVGGVTKEITKSLLAKGWDLSTYWNASNVPTDAQLSGTSESDLEACKLYVKTGLESQEANGFFNPISWSCRQNKYGETLGKALEFYGYKICRGGGNNGFDQNISESFTRTNATGIYSNNWSTVKLAIDEAIINNQAINVFTHFVVETQEEDRGYDCLKSTYITFLDYIKGLESQGKVIIMNYREFYAFKHPNSAYEIDYNRMIKRMNYIDSFTNN